MAIVVCSDRSERASRMLPHAAALARATRRPLLVVSVLDAPLIEPIDREDGWPAIEAEREIAVDEIEHALRSADCEAEVLVRAANQGESVARAIVRLSVDHRAMAIVMASRGANLARHAAIGSVAMDVVRVAHLPVLLGTDRMRPPTAATEGPYTVICGVDGSPDSEAMVGALGPLLQGTEARLVLARVDEWAIHDFIPDGRSAALEADLRRAARLLPSNVTPEFAVVRRRGLGVPDALIALAEERGAGATALATHGHRASRRFFAGSDAMAVLERSPLPIFLTHG